MPGTGGAIAAPASETLATGLEDGIEYEARVSGDGLGDVFFHGLFRPGALQLVDRFLTVF